MKRSDRQPGNDRHAAGDVAVPADAPPWVTAELIRLTIKVWQKYYSAPLTVQDAVTILQNTGRLIGALASE